MNQLFDTPAEKLAKFPEQARLLASLTQDLALCCLGKESEIFAVYGLSSSEGRVLLTLSEAGAMTPSRLAARQGVSRSRITPLVASLVECGFVTRTESRRDRRARDLALTSRGQEVAEHAGNFRLDFHTQLLRTFPEAAREDLLKTLAVLHERIRKLRAELKTRDGRQRRE